MDRRDFLTVGVVEVAGLVSVSGSAGASILKFPEGRPRPIPLPDMEAYIARVDGGMESISRWSPSSGVPSYSGDRDAIDNLARKSLRTLYMTAMFSDLPEEGQRHPGMQDRIFDAMPEMDEATAGMTAFLATRSPEKLGELQLALRDPTNPAMDIFDALDRGGASLGLSTRRRLQTRVMMTQANWRLRNQPPSLVISETLDKVERMVPTDVSLEAKRDWIAGRVAEQLFWQQEASGRETLVSNNVETEQGSGSKGENQPRSTRERRISRGGQLMGIGILVGGLAAAGAAAGAFPLVFVATAGVVLILIGLITLLIGLMTPGEPKASP